MHQTNFAQIARTRAVRFTPPATIEAALVPLASSAEQSVETLDRERKIQMVTRFVRAIPALGVHASAMLEHELLDAIGVSRTGRYVIVVQNAISLISVRNHLHELAALVGFSWSDGMTVQSAVSDVARYLVDHGGGTIEMQTTEDHRIAVSVHSKLNLGLINASPGPGTPPWLAGAMNLATQFRSPQGGLGSNLEFSFDVPRAAVA